MEKANTQKGFSKEELDGKMKKTIMDLFAKLGVDYKEVEKIFDEKGGEEVCGD
jgi:hypothetical protein